MKKLLSLFMMLILSAFVFTTCKKDKGTAPALPPKESLTIDFTNFTSLTKSAALSFDQKGTNNSSWGFVAGDGTIDNPGIALWRQLIIQTLIIPVTAFNLALDNDPVSIGSNTWQWSYSVTPADVTYKARLTGEISSGDVIWKMYVSRDGSGGFAEFVWFEGKSKVDGTEGQWTFNESAATPQPVLQIDWTKPTTTIGTITYTYLKNDTYKNNYIEYGKGTTTSTLYDAYYKISLTNIRGTFIANVEWNTTTKNGRVKCPDYLDGKWFCWGSDKINNLVNCPQ
jgi:hypothetical protein